MDTPTADSRGARMMGLQATGYELGARSDEARNSGSWERRGEELTMLGTTQEKEDRYNRLINLLRYEHHDCI